MDLRPVRGCFDWCSQASRSCMVHKGIHYVGDAAVPLLGFGASICRGSRHSSCSAWLFSGHSLMATSCRELSPECLLQDSMLRQWQLECSLAQVACTGPAISYTKRSASASCCDVQGSGLIRPAVRLVKPTYRIFCSVNRTCFRTLGSYFTNCNLLGSVRAFFFLT